MCPIRVELHRGDIVSVQANVCVSSIHRSKDMTMGPLAGHILKCAGKSIQDEMYKKQPGIDLKMGQVEVVSPGKLSNFQELMFICLLHYKERNEEILQQSILECLELAAVKKYKSIAFPALGVGQEYPSEKVATCLIEAVALHNYQYPDTSLDVVHIVLLDEDTELIKKFLLICVKGTTDLQADKTQPACGQDCASDLISGLSLEGVHNLSSRGESTYDSSKLRTQPQPPKPKVTRQKKIGSQQSGKQSSGFSGIVSLFASLISKQGLSYQVGVLKFNVRPNISRKMIGAQLNVGIDISVMEKFIPNSLISFFESINK